MGSRFWIILALILFFFWGIYADYSVEIARFFAESRIASDESGSEISKAGAWGDTFGAFNAIVSLAGAVFIVRTLILQQQALSDQQLAIKRQFEDSYRQRFEATFFELLKLLRELRGELRYSYSDGYLASIKDEKIRKSREGPKSGTDALLAFAVEHKSLMRSDTPKGNFDSRQDIGRIYDKAMTANTERTFSPYYRMIYTLLARLRNDKILTVREKEDYSRLIRSQLTNIELLALALNALSERSADLEDLIRQFRLFKYFPAGAQRQRYEKIFGPICFAARD